MFILEVALLAIILLIAMFMEKTLFYIYPIIWYLGGSVALFYAITGNGIVSWTEAVVCAVIIMAICILGYSKISSFMGGGIVKCLCMCGLFLGRYTIVTIILCIIISVILYLMKCRNKVPAMPIVFCAVMVTMAFVGVLHPAI